MVKIREPASLDTAALAEKFGNDALPKPKRTKPANQFKSINIPFTEEEYNRLIKAAAKADRKPTDFIKKAIKKSTEETLRKR